MQIARSIKTRVRKGRKTRAVKLSTTKTLCGPYSVVANKPVLKELALPTIHIPGKLVVRGIIIGENEPGKMIANRRTQVDVERLDIRENWWLRSSSIVGALLIMKGMYQVVGIINPRFQGFDTMEQNLRIARPSDVGEYGLKSVISAINPGHHIYFFFDPMQLQSSLSTPKNAVCSVFKKILELTDKLDYQVVTVCVQQNFLSCGLWCLIVLELL
ncbi:hypothetical protein PHMEG_00021719 [Phytophthora megakarya]|uniref:Uncharacterized protein n=1 Tax=Phytophthora megakarya TaxID=4795 RepID=A0A225VM34_9STRA|nr:hypothetical protein PHMEG_00021719 [Phytophthora megakarya]